MGKIPMDLQRFYSRPLEDVISARTSIRSYCPGGIPKDLRSALETYIQEDQQSFYQGKSRLLLLEDQSLLPQQKGKLGTYGVIKGASTFVVGICEEREEGIIELGYRLESLILYCTELSLGTCWLGGTFKREAFQQSVAMGPGEILPAVSPIGLPTEKRGLLDRLMRTAIRAKNRLPWESIFFLEGVHQPLSPKEAAQFRLPLEMVRLAPSASNRQPWRVIKGGEAFHFYRKGSFSIQLLDMGIALCHFQMMLTQQQIPGRWIRQQPMISVPEDFRYVYSWIPA